MSKPRPRIRVPKSASVGEVVTLKTLISHKMESGQRKDKSGNPIPRKIINRFSCTFNGKPVFSCDIDPAISANPFLEFSARIDAAGEFEFTWEEDGGAVYTAKKKLKVS